MHEACVWAFSRCSFALTQYAGLEERGWLLLVSEGFFKFVLCESAFCKLSKHEEAFLSSCWASRELESNSESSELSLLVMRTSSLVMQTRDDASFLGTRKHAAAFSFRSARWGSRIHVWLFRTLVQAGHGSSEDFNFFWESAFSNCEEKKMRSFPLLRPAED